MPTGAAGNGLLTALIAYWPLNEASGNAFDLHTNALHLTDVNTVTSNPGKVYALARQYTRNNVEYHTRPGDDALLSAQDIDFTVAAWVYLDNKPGTMAVVTKMGSAGQRGYMLQYDASPDRWTFVVSNDGTALIIVTANSFGSPPTGSWMLIVGWHDSVANTINIQVNNGTVDSAAHTTGQFDNTAPFRIGAHYTNHMNGRIQSAAFWKSAGGGGGVLTAVQRTALWKGGAGLPYDQFTV